MCIFSQFRKELEIQQGAHILTSSNNLSLSAYPYFLCLTFDKSLMWVVELFNTRCIPNPTLSCTSHAIVPRLTSPYQTNTSPSPPKSSLSPNIPNPPIPRSHRFPIHQDPLTASRNPPMLIPPSQSHGSTLTVTLLFSGTVYQSKMAPETQVPPVRLYFQRLKRESGVKFGIWGTTFIFTSFLESMMWGVWRGYD